MSWIEPEQYLAAAQKYGATEEQIKILQESDNEQERRLIINAISNLLANAFIACLIEPEDYDAASVFVDSRFYPPKDKYEQSYNTKQA